MGVLAAGCAGVSWTTDTNSVSPEETVILPEPRTESGVSVEEALNARRSTKDYTGRQLSLADAGQILWAAQGVTDGRGYRTAPSAGGLYPSRSISSQEVSRRSSRGSTTTARTGTSSSWSAPETGGLPSRRRP